MVYLAEVKRKKGETFESFLRRFNKKLLQSGRLFQARKVRFFSRPDSQTKKKAVALRKKQIHEKREYLKKIGKLKEDVSPGRRSS